MSLRFSEIPSEDTDEEEWLIQIKQGLQAQHAIARPPTVCIFTVPKILINLKRDAYLPQVVSIGPCYHRTRGLSDMDSHKLRAAQMMIKRLHGKADINSLAAEMEKMDAQIRDSYEKIIDFNSETLAWIMLLDASFLLEILRTLAGNGRFDSFNWCMYFEPLFDESRLKSVGFAVLGDMVKLENQIPLFVLYKILQMEGGSEEEAQTRLFDLLLKAAASFFPFKYLQISGFDLNSPFIVRDHFLGFLHGLTRFFFFSGKNSSAAPVSAAEERRFNHGFPCISSLIKAGIQIRPYEGDGGKALRFDKEASVLYLPAMSITENTETVVRNLMSMEAFLPSELQVISCYVGLMNSLIFTEQDVKLLRMAGVLCIHVGNEAQVSQLCDDLCKGMAISSLEELRRLKKEITKVYKSKWRARILDFFTSHRAKPWLTALPVLSAIFIFIFTLTQALSSINDITSSHPLV